MITKITDVQEKMREAFYKVFVSRNPFEPAAELQMPRRVVIYPTYGYHLEENQFQALVDASSKCGETCFFISEVEYDPDPFLMDRHWVCISPTFAEYSSLLLSVENAIYSPGGKWGILVSHEDHALLVSQENFWEAFQEKYTKWRDDRNNFVETWQHNEKEFGADIDWVRDFLAHLSEPL